MIYRQGNIPLKDSFLANILALFGPFFWISFGDFSLCVWGGGTPISDKNVLQKGFSARGVPAKYFLTASLISNPFIISECKIDIHNIHLLECPSTSVMPGVNCQKRKRRTRDIKTNPKQKGKKDKGR